MKRILVIEDNIDMSENTAEILETADYQVITAADGKTGLHLAVLCDPDLIISDITMPELDGFNLLKALSKTISARKTPFIFLTARTEKENMIKGAELGAAAYITKPFSGNALLKVVSDKINEFSKLKSDEKNSTD